MTELSNGLLWISTPKYTVALKVVNGVITEAPPYARQWTLGRQAKDVYRRAMFRSDARIEWIPDEPPSAPAST